jgi:hypothetical protein
MVLNCCEFWGCYQESLANPARFHLLTVEIGYKRPSHQPSLAAQDALLPPPANRYLLDHHLFQPASRRKVSAKTVEQFIELGGVLRAFSCGD